MEFFISFLQRPLILWLVAMFLYAIQNSLYDRYLEKSYPLINVLITYGVALIILCLILLIEFFRGRIGIAASPHNKMIVYGLTACVLLIVPCTAFAMRYLYGSDGFVAPTNEMIICAFAAFALLPADWLNFKGYYLGGNLIEMSIAAMAFPLFCMALSLIGTPEQLLRPHMCVAYVCGCAMIIASSWEEIGPALGFSRSP